ncbi:PepSY domain-containing protein [Paludibacterium yongneupense]|uniref:PepSY domain-containing protein n=1 Tax=Paludibacterium yongneupense TaxID=400061 RepID=UPI00146B0552|nr:PepSY domain-containing protein [Paludibacterium yongneupense]
MKRIHPLPSLPSPALIVAMSMAVVLGLSWLAHSVTLGRDEDGRLFERGTLTHGQALALAGSYGTPSRARLERRHGHWVYRVDVLRAGRFIDVEVDPFSGKVVPHLNDDARQSPTLPTDKLECYDSIYTCF